MNIALVGGTHGNEPVGIEVMKLIKSSTKEFNNSVECFWANPEAYKLKKRYVDSDLNRAFGKNARPHGHEAHRAVELEEMIRGQFDLCIDLHTTTSNMGLTAILNNTHEWTRTACFGLKQKMPEVKLIEEDQLDLECTHLNRLCPGGVTLEVGPVANNVVSGDLVLKLKEMVEMICNLDFNQQVNFDSLEYFKQSEQINYPEEQGWYIHPRLEGQDFQPLKTGDPIFINGKEEVRFWERETVYPFFINEAAYLENRSAFLIAHKRSYQNEKTEL